MYVILLLYMYVLYSYSFHHTRILFSSDPRRFGELMAVNTMKQINDSGLALDLDNNPEFSQQQGTSSSHGGHRHRGAGEVERGRQQRWSPRSNGSPRNNGSIDYSTNNRSSSVKYKPYENHSTGGGSGPSSGSPASFMSSLAAMNGPSPEEKRRADRKKQRLQEDLFDQVQQQRHGQVLKGMCSFICCCCCNCIYCYCDTATTTLPLLPLLPLLPPSPLIPTLPLTPNRF